MLVIFKNNYSDAFDGTVDTPILNLALSFVSNKRLNINTPILTLSIAIASDVRVPFRTYVTEGTTNLALSFISNKRLNINTPVLTLGVSFVSNSLVPRISPPLNLAISIAASSPNVFKIKDEALIRYFLILTGSADGLSDFELPLKSFQAVRRTGADTYLSVAIPTIDYADEITARQNGQIVIKQGFEYEGEIVQTEVIIQTSLDVVNIYQGGNNQSIVLTGYQSTSYSPKTITLTKPYYRAVLDGKIHYRVAKPNIFLNPGDTVVIDSDTFIIDTMSYAVSARNTLVELKEA